MRLRNVKNKQEIMDKSKILVINPENYKGKWNKLFGNNNPIYIEIGMGKGDFIIEHAKRNPEINTLGYYVWLYCYLRFTACGIYVFVF